MSDDLQRVPIAEAVERLEVVLSLSDSFQFHVVAGAAPGLVREVIGRALAVTPAPRARIDPYASLDAPLQPMTFSLLAQRVLRRLTERQRGAAGEVCWLDASSAPPGDHAAWASLFQQMNAARNAIVARHNGPFLFSAAPALMVAFGRAAPDFWSIRTVVLDLEDDRPPEALSPAWVARYYFFASRYGVASRWRPATSHAEERGVSLMAQRAELARQPTDAGLCMAYALEVSAHVNVDALGDPTGRAAALLGDARGVAHRAAILELLAWRKTARQAERHGRRGWEAPHDGAVSRAFVGAAQIARDHQNALLELGRDDEALLAAEEAGWMLERAPVATVVPMSVRWSLQRDRAVALFVAARGREALDELDELVAVLRRDAGGEARTHLTRATELSVVMARDLGDVDRARRGLGEAVALSLDEAAGGQPSEPSSVGVVLRLGSLARSCAVLRVWDHVLPLLDAAGSIAGRESVLSASALHWRWVEVTVATESAFAHLLRGDPARGAALYARAVDTLDDLTRRAREGGRFPAPDRAVCCARLADLASRLGLPEASRAFATDALEAMTSHCGTDGLRRRWGDLRRYMESSSAV